MVPEPPLEPLEPPSTSAFSPAAAPTSTSPTKSPTSPSKRAYQRPSSPTTTKPRSRSNSPAARITFATPLPQSPRSETLEWRFPRPFSQYTLIGKSRAAWHTSFVVPQLNLLLDAGLIVNNLRPKHVFLTHGHSDHSLMAPVFITMYDPPDIYCPREMETVLQDYMRAKIMLNCGGSFGELKKWNDKQLPSSSSSSSILEEEKGKGEEEKEVDEVDEDLDDDPDSIDVLDSTMPTHYTYGLSHSSTVKLRRQPQISATAFDCDHKVPCLGYVFYQTSNKLLPQYTSLPGAEIGRLKHSGKTMTYEVRTPIFAFLGDTTAKTLLSEPEWLSGTTQTLADNGGEVQIPGAKVVITECSFLHESHRKNAEKTKHTLWSDLEPVVRKYTETTFVLIHFSLRYTVDEIKSFFEGLKDRPKNIVVWVDGGK